MDISGLLGDLYESADRAPTAAAGVTETSAIDATDVVAVDGEHRLDADRAAEHRAAQLRAEEAASLAAAAAEAPASELPTTVEHVLHHEMHHDNLLPRRSGRRLRLV